MDGNQFESRILNENLEIIRWVTVLVKGIFGQLRTDTK